MKAHTHVLGGLAVAEVVLSLGASHPLPLMLASAFGALVPDWDHPGSTLGRWVPWPSVSQSRGPNLPPRVGRWGCPHPIWHRHQAHSVFAVLLASMVLTGLAAVGWHAVPVAVGGATPRGVFPGWAVLWGLILGGLSHLVLDGFNQTPQWWGWPISRKGYRWPVHASVYRIDALTAGALSVVVGLLTWHLGHTPRFYGWLSAW